MNRRNFIGMSSAAAMGAAASSAKDEGPQPASQRGSMPARPNLIIYMPDELRADSLATYGNPITKTPNFDHLASTGTMFENCYIQYPVCGASRCSLLTGWPTSVHGHRSLYYFLRPEEPNLFRYLRQAGYDVFWYGKNDALASQSFYDSVTHWADVSARASARGITDLTPGSFSMLYSAGGDRRATSDYQHLQMGIKILERKESDRPFCLFLPLIEPHPPYTAPADFYSLYSPASLPALSPPGLKKKPNFHEGMRRTYKLDTLNDATFRQIRSVYYGQVTYADWLLGELLEAMERTGRNKDTALFVTSDHGDYAGDYGLVEKWPSGLEDCLTRVPLLAKVPGGAEGVNAKDVVEMYDIMQTSLELAGTRANHTHFSRSLLPQIAGGPGDPQRAAFAEGGYNVYEPQCFEPAGAGGGPYVGKIRLQNEEPAMVSRSSMVRTRTHKLIVRPQGGSELYSSAKDPREEDNLFGEKGVAGVQLELQNKLLDHYINTTGIAPMDKDPRQLPPYSPTRTDLTPAGWQKDILDRE